VNSRAVIRSVGRQVDREGLREAKIAGFGGEAHARPSIVDRKLVRGDERGEQRLACVRRALAGEPQRLRIGQHAVAVTLATILNAVARELGVFRSRRRIERSERRPLSPLAQRLEPVDAQPVGERCFRPSREVRVDLGIGRGVELELLLPILDVLSQDVIRELGASASRRPRSPRSNAMRASRKSLSDCASAAGTPQPKAARATSASTTIRDVRGMTAFSATRRHEGNPEC
jgi:hypothetical protein